MKHQKKYLFDDPKNIKWLLRLLYFIVDFIIHRREYEGEPGKVGWSMS